MKDQLLERLKLMDDAIKEKGQQLQQANADLNLLNGQRVELVHIINLIDKPKELHEVKDDEVKLDDCIGE